MQAIRLVIVAALVLGARSVASQSPSVGERPKVGRGSLLPAPSTISLWLAGARGAEIKTRAGEAHDRSLYLVSLQARWPVFDAGALGLEYTADFVPLAIATANRFYRGVSYCLHSEPCRLSQQFEVERRTAYAAGLAPLGLTARIRLKRTLTLSVSGSGGFLWFSRPVPEQDAERLNWTGDAAAALSVSMHPRYALGFGYRFYHVSNGGRGAVNPGMNTHLFFIELARSLQPTGR